MALSNGPGKRESPRRRRRKSLCETQEASPGRASGVSWQFRRVGAKASQSVTSTSAQLSAVDCRLTVSVAADWSCHTESARPGPICRRQRRSLLCKTMRGISGGTPDGRGRTCISPSNRSRKCDKTVATAFPEEKPEGSGVNIAACTRLNVNSCQVAISGTVTPRF